MVNQRFQACRWLAVAAALAVLAQPGFAEPKELPEPLKDFAEFAEACEKYQSLQLGVKWKQTGRVDFEPTDDPKWKADGNNVKAEVIKLKDVDGKANYGVKASIPAGGGSLLSGLSLDGPGAIEMRAKSLSASPCDLSLFLGDAGTSAGFQFGGWVNTRNLLKVPQMQQDPKTGKWKAVRATQQQLPHPPRIVTDQWHVVRLELVAGKMRALVDGQLLGEAELPPQFDFESAGDARGYWWATEVVFDWIRVERARNEELDIDAVKQAFGDITPEQIDKKIRQLIGYLDSDLYEVRQGAQEILVRAGRLAVEPLKEAARDGSVEQQLRATQLLKRLNLRVGEDSENEGEDQAEADGALDATRGK